MKSFCGSLFCGRVNLVTSSSHTILPFQEGEETQGKSGLCLEKTCRDTYNWEQKLLNSCILFNWFCFRIYVIISVLKTCKLQPRYANSMFFPSTLKSISRFRKGVLASYTSVKAFQKGPLSFFLSSSLFSFISIRSLTARNSIPLLLQIIGSDWFEYFFFLLSLFCMWER